MKPTRRTGYGIFDTTRQIARRVQRVWEEVEYAPRPSPEVQGEMIPFPTADIVPFPVRSEKRPLAA